MSTSLLADAFGHHVWATQQLIDSCLALDAEQLETGVPGTYGSILKTQRHLVGSDAWYLLCITADPAHQIDEDHMDLAQLRAAIGDDGAAWSRLLAEDVDPDAVLREVDDEDGYEKQATLGIRLAQALHHGTDHRSQICTALSTLGVGPPAIDVWDYGVVVDRVVEVPPTS
ncbi:MAG: DinB family protein [Actinomycetota bacterium]